MYKPYLQKIIDGHREEEASNFTLPVPLPVQILNTPYRLRIADLAEGPLGRRKIGMAEDNLADQLNRNP